MFVHSYLFGIISFSVIFFLMHWNSDDPCQFHERRASKPWKIITVIRDFRFTELFFCTFLSAHFQEIERLSFAYASLLICFELWVAVRFYSWFTFSESSYNMRHNIGSYDTKHWQSKAAKKKDRKISELCNCDKHRQKWTNTHLSKFHVKLPSLSLSSSILGAWGLMVIHILLLFFLKNNTNEKKSIPIWSLHFHRKHEPTA